jgi:hypothetical protein
VTIVSATRWSDGKVSVKYSYKISGGKENTNVISGTESYVEKKLRDRHKWRGYIDYKRPVEEAGMPASVHNSEDFSKRTIQNLLNLQKTSPLPSYLKNEIKNAIKNHKAGNYDMELLNKLQDDFRFYHELAYDDNRERVAAKKDPWRRDDLDEAGMPASVIKNKEKLSQMTDKELADKFSDKSEKELRDMAARHGYGWNKATKTGSDHYLKRVQKGKSE